MADKTTNYNLTKPSADDFYDVGVQNGNMDIVDAELKKLNDGKAPSGHGLGGITKDNTDPSLFEMLKRGCGFYTIAEASDTPYVNGEWLSALQLVRQTKEGDRTGAQLAFYDFSPTEPKMWLRTTLKGQAGNWVEMLHTGNIANYANTRIATGTYQGAGVYGEKNKNKLTFPFEPKLVIVQAVNAEDAIFLILVNPTTLANGQFYYGFTKNVVSWSGNTVEWYCTARFVNGNSGVGSEVFQMNQSGITYTYIAIG